MKLSYNQLLKIRTDKNLLQKDIATIINRDKATVSMIENHKQSMTESQIVLLCKFLNCSADDLLGLKNQSRS